MDHRMERADAMFTGTAKSKVIADICFGDEETFKVYHWNFHLCNLNFQHSCTSYSVSLFGFEWSQNIQIFEYDNALYIYIKMKELGVSKIYQQESKKAILKGFHATM